MRRPRLQGREIIRSAAIKNSENCVNLMKENDKKCIMYDNGFWDRPVSARPRMPRAQRAKQFAPFDALTGLSERLRQAEEEHERELQSGTRISGDDSSNIQEGI